MIGLEMAGISNKWILALATLALAFSCTREAPLSEPQDMPGEYDPVVRFGLETYMGPDNATKTTYAGDDQTILLSSVRYERINWNVDPSATDVPLKPIPFVSWPRRISQRINRKRWITSL